MNSNNNLSEPEVEKKLHLIAFDVPFPPNYGGIVDVFYKLKSLHQQRVKIIYHCFYYSGHNPPNDELEKYCEKVYYYQRKKQYLKLFFGLKPYVVSTRKNADLLADLMADEYPIFFDGLQTCFYLNHPSLKNRKKYVRANNIEHEYYLELAKVERKFLKRWYLQHEAKRLARFETELAGADAIFAVARMEIKHFEKYSRTVHVPPFFKNEHEPIDVNKSGIQGPYILFQGNLSVRENELAAKFILNKIAPLVKHDIVIAGKSPSNWLKNEVLITENARIISSPTSVQMDALIQYAKINLLITFQQTGIKLKLLHALESGKHIIINSLMDDDGIFSDLCHVRDEPEEIAKKINELMKVEFTEEEANKRLALFSAFYNNERNAKKIIHVIFESETE